MFSRSSSLLFMFLDELANIGILILLCLAKEILVIFLLTSSSQKKKTQIEHYIMDTPSSINISWDSQTSIGADITRFTILIAATII